ncbi:MAG: hypothetical protein ACYDER_25960 [Ktedonobacteraceae bacterium]
MAGPLAGWGGKPLLDKESDGHRFVGRLIIELYEGPDVTSDANGLVFSVSPSIEATISQHELLKRFAAALPARVAKMPDMDERRRQAAQKHGGTY